MNFYQVPQWLSCHEEESENSSVLLKHGKSTLLQVRQHHKLLFELVLIKITDLSLIIKDNILTHWPLGNPTVS